MSETVERLSGDWRKAWSHAMHDDDWQTAWKVEADENARLVTGIDEVLRLQHKLIVRSPLRATRTSCAACRYDWRCPTVRILAALVAPPSEGETP